MRETVRTETVPRHLWLRLAMGEASRNIAANKISKSTPLNSGGLRNAARILDDSKSTAKFDGLRLIHDAREALGVPEHETTENVDLLLGRAALTLDELAEGVDVGPADLYFTDTVVRSMRAYAAERRSHPTDVVVPQE
jgi:hypothetical protein